MTIPAEIIAMHCRGAHLLKVVGHFSGNRFYVTSSVILYRFLSFIVYWYKKHDSSSHFFFFFAENTFEVQLNKDNQGLGFSVMGGRGSHDDPRKCLIRIKKLFPGQGCGP